MSNPRRCARRLAGSLRSSATHAREYNAEFYYRHGLLRFEQDVLWLYRTSLETEEDWARARELAFGLVSSLHTPMSELHRNGNTLVWREIRQAQRDAIALCESLSEHAPGVGPMQLVFGFVYKIRAARADARAAAEELARKRMHALVTAELAGRRKPPGAGAVRVAATSGKTCRNLVALAVRILPLEHRDRYAEEFRADLALLRRRQRLTHAVRLVIYSWSLRQVLAVPVVPAAVGVSRDEESRY